MIPPVPDRKTPLVPGEAWEALRDAWQDAPPNAIAVLMAQIGLETAWGECHCYNLGNVKATGDTPWCTFATWEIINGRRVDLAPGDPGARFRAFASLDEGVRFYLDFLRKRFTHAWPAVLAGDPHEFARLLREQRYYTAPLLEYQAGLQRHFEPWMEPPLGTPAQTHEALGSLGYGYADLDPVREFQRAKGLVVDGVTGPQTRAAIREALARTTLPPA